MKILRKKQFIEFVKNRESARNISGNFLSFFMIQIVERFGQWRFAGTATNLNDAIDKLEDLFLNLDGQYAYYAKSKGVVLDPLGKNWFLDFAQNSVLKYSKDGKVKDWSEEWNERRKLGRVRALVLAEGEAPYDDRGFAILYVDSLKNHPYAGRSTESVAPEAWFEGDWEKDIDAGPDEYLPKI